MIIWRKSSRSGTGAQDANCVEVAQLDAASDRAEERASLSQASRLVGRHASDRGASAVARYAPRPVPGTCLAVG
jgi:Domain of unknown function (DUF397)